MITEDYVSFEVAKLLKEKGFDEPCHTFYEYKKKLYKDMDRYFPNGMTNTDHNKEGNGGIAAPTLQMAIKWLREEYNLFIEIQCYGCEANEKAHFEFSYVISEYVQFDNKICTTVGLDKKKAKSQFKSYEEACEAAIRYCLENLI